MKLFNKGDHRRTTIMTLLIIMAVAATGFITTSILSKRLARVEAQLDRILTP